MTNVILDLIETWEIRRSLMECFIYSSENTSLATLVNFTALLLSTLYCCISYHCSIACAQSALNFSLQVMHNVSPVTLVNYWWNCAEGV